MPSGWHEGSLSDLSCLHRFPMGGVPFASFERCVSPGVAHFRADALCEDLPSWVSFTLSWVLFVGVPLVALFASPDPALRPLFYSWIPGPQVLGVDAFSVPWPVGLLCAFPPIPHLPWFLL